MDIHFKDTENVVSPQLRERTDKKLAKLARMIEDKEYQSKAHLVIDKAIGSHQTGDVWQCVVNVDAKGTRYHASAIAPSADAATDQALNEVTTEIRRAHAKELTLSKRGGSFLKSMLRFGR